MDELATVPALADYERGFKRCAVHQQTQRTYALGDDLDDGEGTDALLLLDANLQVIATVEAAGVAKEHDDYDPIRDVAVHGDQVIVLTTDNHPKGSGLRLLDLDGRFLRTIAAGKFYCPQAVAASHGRAFVVDDNEVDDEVDDDESGKVLHVIDIQSGHIFQSVRFDLAGVVSAILVDGDEIYISSFYGANEVLVLQFAGSEA